MTRSRVARFRRSAFLLLLTVPPLPRHATAQCPDAQTLTRNLKGPQATVRYLADDALEGRLAGSAGERCAGDYIASRFTELRLEPGGEFGSYFQLVPLASVAHPHAPAGQGRNIIAFLRGADPRLRDEWIVIGAHYDHLGRGQIGSPAPDRTSEIYNGADDNASGVAALLEAARQLSMARPARSIAFVAFTGEESGILGSTHFAAQPTVPLTRVRAMLNMDMVGRLATGQLIIYGTGTAVEWDTILREATAAEQVDFAAQRDGIGPSDHTAFYLKDVPVLHFFTNTHADYHKPSDDWQKVDGPGLERVARVVTRVARAIAGREPPLTLVRGAGQPPAPGGQSRGNTYLGTVPDFRPVDKGVLLSGVTAGSPADSAGIRAGDIIVRFDDTEISSLEGMTEALRVRKPGDRVRITVLRDGKPVILTAVLGRRA